VDQQTALSVSDLKRMIENLPDTGRVLFAGWQHVHTLAVYESWTDADGNLHLTFENIN
jgi:hypothetical protein